jgi:hypothetical protein
MNKFALAVISLIVLAGSLSAKNLLEKTIYFVNPTTNKIDSAKYWKIFVGSYPATLQRKFPGEETATINTDLNLTILSSGYAEGYGYSKKGRIDCEATLMTDSATSQKVSFDSIEYVYNGGSDVKTKNKPASGMYLDVEGNKVMLTRGLALTKYRLVVVEEDRNLKPDGDVNISFFAFSKSAISAAQKAEKEAEAQTPNQ